MAGLSAGEFAVPVERQQYFFGRHLAPWIGRFFADLEAAQAANFYRPVGTIGRVFVEIETDAFALPA
jgi:TorA maturation chaperone TorD